MLIFLFKKKTALNDITPMQPCKIILIKYVITLCNLTNKKIFIY